jgi:succinoglycan biosynthesis protein ExoA
MPNSFTYSVVCPTYNEVNYIESLIDFLSVVSPPPKEIFFIDGLSTDGTRSVIHQALLKYPEIRLIDNPDKHVSFALNRAIPMCTTDIIVRVDAHTIYAQDYFSRIITTFKQVNADIVGGPTRTAFKSPFQEAVAYLFNTPLGMGNSSVHNVDFEGYTDSVTFGAWKREVFNKIGYFDTRLKRNQDDEFHYRAKSNGIKIYQSPDIKLWYYPRSSWQGLFLQYYQYGLYKPIVLFKIKSGLQLRHLIPSAFVLYLTLVVSIAWMFPLVLLPLVVYLLLVVISTLKAHVSLPARWRIPFAYLGVHLGYGIGFLIGLLRRAS